MMRDGVAPKLVEDEETNEENKTDDNKDDEN